MKLKVGDILRVSLDRIRIDPTRLEAKDTAILDVVDVDFLPPIKVQYDGNNFWIVNGHHRYRTALKQGKTEMWISLWRICQEDGLTWYRLIDS